MSNLAQNLLDTATRRPDHVAIRQDDLRLTFAELEDASARVAALLLSRGVSPGDRVAVIEPNVSTFPVVYYGILRAGAVVVPMNPLLKGREIAFTFTDSGVRLVFVSPMFADEATTAGKECGVEVVVTAPGQFDALLQEQTPRAGLVERDPGDTAVILYTSGTTGTPKGAELTHANLLSNVTTNLETVALLSEDDVLFGGLPLFHSFGQTCALNSAVGAGATLTLLPRFEPGKALDIVARDKVTMFLGVPTMYSALLAAVDHGHPLDAGSLRTAVSGGASLPLEVLRRFEEVFGCPLLEGYGLSETAPVASFNHPGRPSKAGSIGTPIRGVEFRLVDPLGADVPTGEIGEIVIRGENVMKGYWNRPDETLEAVQDGWFHTGDLARVDEDGYYFIADRKKDMIIRGGFNVYPREVENELYEHPAVAEAAVVGIPHPTHGEEIAAVITLREGASASAEEIRDFVKERLAAYKYPRVVTFVEALPKGPTGKILKREIVVERDAPTG